MSPLVQHQLQTLDPDKLSMFLATYNSRKRSVEAMEALAILFPIQMLLLGKVGLWFAFFFTGGGLGIWYIVEWFLTPGRVRTYNDAIATELLMQMKTLA
jgi:hypothetical protein